MKAFFKIIVIIVLLFILGGVGRISWLCIKEPNLVRDFFSQTESSSFKDESKIIIDPHHPKVIAPTVSLKKLLSESRIKRMRLRRSAARSSTTLVIEGWLGTSDFWFDWFFWSSTTLWLPAYSGFFIFYIYFRVSL